MFEAIAIIPILCGGEIGTGWATAPHRLATAAHVTELGGCRAGPGQLSPVGRAQGDFAELRTGQAMTPISISCAGLVAGQQYRLAGFAADGEHLIFSRATGAYGPGGRAMMRGLAIKGMSGGPVLNEAGEAVAVISAVHPPTRQTLVVELSKTTLCR